ncbi:MAG: Rv3654c family TadE-like protein [Candidatus Nanopelagicales bacterium]
MRRDDGAAAPITLALVGVLLACALALGVVGELLAARQRAADVADLAALAAVSSVLPDATTACADAAWVVQVHGERLASCDVVDGDVRVVVSAPVTGLAARVLTAVVGPGAEVRAEARAGRR